MNVVYILTIQWIGVLQPLVLYFSYPPTRESLCEILRQEWLKTSAEVQDNTWEFRLIGESCPEHPWKGTVVTIYGTLTCQPMRLY